MDLYLTTADTAALLKLSVRRVRQMRDELGAELVAGVLLYPAARVRAAAAKPRPKRGPKPGQKAEPKKRGRKK